MSASMGRPTRPSPVWVATAVAVVFAGCGATRSAGRSLAEGALEGLTARETTLVAMEGRLADSAGAYLRREFRDAVIDPARATWDTMARQVRAEADSSAARVAQAVRGSISDAVGELLERSFDVVEARAERLGRTVPDAATPALERSLATSFGAVGDTLAHHLSAGLAAGLEEQLRPALHALMRDLSDSLRARVGDLDRTVVESSTVSGARSFLVGSAVALLAAAAVLILLSWRRHRRALHAMLDAVELTGDEHVRETVRGCAGQAGVGDWLASRAASRRSRGGRPSNQREEASE